MSTKQSNISGRVPESVRDKNPPVGSTEDILLPSSVKGHQSIPDNQRNPTGSKKSKTVVKRTNSMKDRFSNAKLVFQNGGTNTKGSKGLRRKFSIVRSVFQKDDERTRSTDNLKVHSSNQSSEGMKSWSLPRCNKAEVYEGRLNSTSVTDTAKRFESNNRQSNDSSQYNFLSRQSKHDFKSIFSNKKVDDTSENLVETDKISPVKVTIDVFETNKEDDVDEVKTFNAYVSPSIGDIIRCDGRDESNGSRRFCDGVVKHSSTPNSESSFSRVAVVVPRKKEDKSLPPYEKDAEDQSLVYSDNNVTLSTNNTDIGSNHAAKSVDKSLGGENNNSLGSSLTGQNVSSWFGTPSSMVSDSSVANCKSGQESLKCTLSAESSDYVSGDSRELGSASSEQVSSKSETVSPQKGSDEAQFLDSGTQGPSLDNTSSEEAWKARSEDYHPPSAVKFSESPVMIYTTYSDDEYIRKNDDIDPAAASAEYELEKRVDKLDIFEVDLCKSDDGLGLSIVGMGVGVDSGIEKLGIFVKAIAEGGAVYEDGRIKVYDQILSVDGSSLVGVTQAFAADALRDTDVNVHFVIGRVKDPEDKEITDLIDQYIYSSKDQDKDVGGLSAKLCDISDVGVDSTTISIGSNVVQPCTAFGNNCDDVKGLIQEEQEIDVEIMKTNDWKETVESVSIENETIWNQKPDKQFAKDEVMRKSCCPYEKMYKDLLVKYDECKETIDQMKTNLKVVTDQLLLRDELFATHMNRIKELNTKLTEKMHEAELAVLQNSLRKVLEPKGSLARKPYIPVSPYFSTPTNLEVSVIPTMYVLDNTFSKRKANLAYRGTLSRRRPSGKAVTRVGERTQQPSSAINLNFASPSDLLKLSNKNMECDFKGHQNDLWSKIVFKTVFDNEEYLEKPELLVYPVPVRTNSLPLPDVCSLYNSSSSLDAAAATDHFTAETRNEIKRRSSGGSMWRKARRRFSSR